VGCREVRPEVPFFLDFSFTTARVSHHGGGYSFFLFPLEGLYSSHSRKDAIYPPSSEVCWVCLPLLVGVFLFFEFFFL